MTLTEFLLARIAEDEVVALEAAKDGLSVRGRSRWQWQQLASKPSTSLIAQPDEGTGLRSVDVIRDDRVTVQIADHIERFDPARVLVECETKRWMVETFGVTDHSRYDEPEVLRRLALPYAEHPDYLEEWRP